MRNRGDVSQSKSVTRPTFNVHGLHGGWWNNQSNILCWRVAHVGGVLVTAGTSLVSLWNWSRAWDRASLYRRKYKLKGKLNQIDSNHAFVTYAVDVAPLT